MAFFLIRFFMSDAIVQSTSSDSSLGSSVRRSVNNHPPGLFLLFSIEMWERMSFYGMRALLVLYMTDVTRGGFGMSRAQALSLYGWYGGLVYFTPLIGGWLADRYLGQRKSVLIGGLLMMLGHFLLALPGVFLFYAALLCIIIGNGFFKPNVSTMVGSLYQADDPRRDGAYTLFYMGINVGSALAPIVCGTLGERVGFHYGFGAAGVGMMLGLVSYLTLAPRFLGTIGMRPAQPKRIKQDLASLENNLTSVEKDRLWAAVVLCATAIVFFAAFEQTGGLMNLYTNEKVDRMLFGFEVPTTWFQALNPVFIIALSPLFSLLWTYLGRRKQDLSIPRKMALGLILVGLGFVAMMGAVQQSQSSGKAHMLWLVLAYFFHSVGELLISPIGLSMVTKLSPHKWVGLMMGYWFVNTAIAEKLAGSIGATVDKWGEMQIFTAIAYVCCLVGIMFWFANRRILRYMHGIH